jgi:hypothetical protein
MKLRLQVTPGPGASFVFEHSGSVLRIGRDPAGELALQGEASQSVSWNHARIDLTPRGAHVSDVGSKNGTFVNDRRVLDKTPLKLGDQIRLGYTGPTLQVIELDLTEVLPPPPPPTASERPVPPPSERRKEQFVADESTGDRPATTTRGMLVAMQRTQRNMLIGIGAGAVCVILLVGVLLWRSGRGNPDQPKEGPERDEKIVIGPPRPPDPGPGNPGEAGERRQPGGGVKPAIPELKGAMPAVQPLDVGAYVHADNEPPSILLQRQRDPEPWERVASGSRVQTEYYLVSLPGFRSKVYLDSKVLLTLWGNVPELSSFPPVLEATVRLHDPARAGVDLDFTLDHGRVVVANRKPKGEARVRVRFRQQSWLLTLPDAASEVALELWGEQPRKGAGGKEPLAYLGLFVKGQARLTTRDREHTLPNSSRVSWSSDNQNLFGPEALPQLPDWWVNKPDLKDDQVVLMIAAIEDLGKKLSANTMATALEVLQTQVREVKIPVKDHVLGVLCLGALDALPHLVEALEDRQYFEVRWAARYALQQWMARNADNALELSRTWQERKSYSRETTETIMWLLYPLSDGEIASAKTYETLITKCLNHDVLAIRQLASWRLGELAPQIAQEILYDPAGDAEHRQKVCQEWMKRLPAGTVPPRPAPAGGTK